MAQEVTLGGDRLGSGKQMQQELHNYGMNSFNQGRDWKSTMAPGVLIPCFKEIGTNHGTFDIDISPFVRTLPTKGPLLGSFKMQVDLFNVPFRLYQGILHNNPVDIGLKMNQVYLPQLVIGTMDGATAPKVAGSTDDDCQVSTNALIKYTGISGLGHKAQQQTDGMIYRKLQCIPELGYYDIFKNYYSNKQEEYAYVITPGNVQEVEATAQLQLQLNTGSYIDITQIAIAKETAILWTFKIKTTGITDIKEQIRLGFKTDQTQAEDNPKIKYLATNNYITILEEKENELIFSITNVQVSQIMEYIGGDETDTSITIKIDAITGDEIPQLTSDINLEPFALKNIDKMRSKLLANNELGDVVTIQNDTEDTDVWGTDSGEDGTGLPYSALVKTTEDGITWNAFEQNGLVVKTYQSDLFNNWLDNSLVDTIAQRTKIDTTSGGFTPDTLILQEKIYKLLNRILVSGGTYYDWQEATYGEGVARMCEIPMYIGGMSTEIQFEEVIANSAGRDQQDRYQALGSLGGKGTLPRDEKGNIWQKGGYNIHVRMDEPGYIIGICSITPRISVNQGNDWDRTEIVTMDDLHKPELDGIGFQDLMVEQMAWWNTVIDGQTVIHRDAVGKQTAWINYQTALDKCYGDFAKQDGYSFMVLSRQYEHDGTFGVKDLTTYIDPAKYNYAFAYQDLAAQNFWVQLNFKCTSRRKMGAQQLPNL